jgi:hypothetical protein
MFVSAPTSYDFLFMVEITVKFVHGLSGGDHDGLWYLLYCFGGFQYAIYLIKLTWAVFGRTVQC